jgi:hypothetical protein
MSLKSIAKKKQEVAIMLEDLLKTKDRIDLVIRSISNSIACSPDSIKVLYETLGKKQQAFNILKLLTLLNKMLFDGAIDFDVAGELIDMIDINITN